MDEKLNIGEMYDPVHDKIVSYGTEKQLDQHSETQISTGNVVYHTRSGAGRVFRTDKVFEIDKAFKTDERSRIDKNTRFLVQYENKDIYFARIPEDFEYVRGYLSSKRCPPIEYCTAISR